VPGGRRGEAPGRRTSRRVPASPTISAGGRYKSGESALVRFVRRPGGRSHTALPALVNIRVTSRRAPSDASGLPRVSSSARSHSYPHTNRGRSYAVTTAVAVVRPPSASARPPGGPALGRTRPRDVCPRRRPSRRRGSVTGRSCCKTEIPG